MAAEGMLEQIHSCLGGTGWVSGGSREALCRSIWTGPVSLMSMEGIHSFCCSYGPCTCNVRQIPSWFGEWLFFSIYPFIFSSPCKKPSMSQLSTEVGFLHLVTFLRLWEDGRGSNKWCFEDRKASALSTTKVHWYPRAEAVKDTRGKRMLKCCWAHLHDIPAGKPFFH